VPRRVANLAISSRSSDASCAAALAVVAGCGQDRWETTAESPLARAPPAASQPTRGRKRPRRYFEHCVADSYRTQLAEGARCVGDLLAQAVRGAPPVQWQALGVVVRGSSGLHALHWETMAGPCNRGDVVGVGIRIPWTADPNRISPASGRVLRLLVMTPRPGGFHDVRPRILSLPLVKQANADPGCCAFAARVHGGRTLCTRTGRSWWIGSHLRRRCELAAWRWGAAMCGGASTDSR
jgi:hypothetical protein